jgi:hypothetical protein
MTAPSHRPVVVQPLASQLRIAFKANRLIEQRQRAELVALLSSLLLQVASAQREEEVDDDHA